MNSILTIASHWMLHECRLSQRMTERDFIADIRSDIADIRSVHGFLSDMARLTVPSVFFVTWKLSSCNLRKTVSKLKPLGIRGASFCTHFFALCECATLFRVYLGVLQLVVKSSVISTPFGAYWRCLTAVVSQLTGIKWLATVSIIFQHILWRINISIGTLGFLFPSMPVTHWKVHHILPLFLLIQQMPKHRRPSYSSFLDVIGYNNNSNIYIFSQA